MPQKIFLECKPGEVRVSTLYALQDNEIIKTLEFPEKFER